MTDALIDTPAPNTAALSALGRAVQKALGEQGELARAIKGFKPRQAQAEMALAVADAIEQASTLVAEAGTGTGKTYAYLVPALLSGGKVLVSTATKTLQDQLFEKDLPMVRAALGRPVTCALLKGRANYVCHHFLERAGLEGRFESKREVEQLQSIQWFAKVSQTGDKSDCSEVPETAPVWSWVTSTRESCLGSDCSFYEDCFVVKARRTALEADVVVVNHHLFLADTALREEGVAEILPTANAVIFDEAHQLADTATTFFGTTVSTHQWQELHRELLVEGRASARDAADWDAVLRPLELALRDLRAECASLNETLRWPAQRFLETGAWRLRLQAVSDAGQTAGLAVDQVKDTSEQWQKLAERLDALSDAWQAWLNPASGEGAEDVIRWGAASHGSVQLHASPMDIASAFQKCREGPARAWVFTSATLSVRGKLDHFVESLGLQQVATGLWPSPFDYEQQGLLCVPAQAPSTTDPQFPERLCESISDVLRAADGGTFFLCTTLRAVQKVADWLKKYSEAHGLEWQLLVQGQASKAELLNRFRSTEKAFLVGAASFWEGVDVKGHQLRLVVIDKIPFAPPDDPIVSARSEWIKSRGGNPFMDLHVPEAAIALKQGAGRLIRDETDRGVLVIGDRRLIEKKYGSSLWRSLPPFKRTQDVAQAVQWLHDMKNTAHS